MAFQFSITYGMHRMQYMYVGLNLYSVEMALNLNVLYSMNLNRNTVELGDKELFGHPEIVP